MDSGVCSAHFSLILVSEKKKAKKQKPHSRWKTTYKQTPKVIKDPNLKIMYIVQL